MIPSDIRFKANPAERSSPSRTALSRADPRWYFTALGVGLVYAVALLSLLFVDRREVPAAPEAEAIPVEIIVEPPPPKKPDSPAEKPAPPAEAQATPEEPAFDAPHAANNEKTEVDGSDRTPKAPPAPEPTKPPSPPPDPGTTAAPPKQEAKLQSHDSPAEPESKAPADAAPAAPAPSPEKPDRPQADAEAQIQAQAEQPRTSTAFQFPPFEATPEFDFGSLFKQTPVAGGKAKATYLSTLYGMIVPRLHTPPGVQTAGLEGTLVFNVDGKGNLRQSRIIQESGSPDLDKAALEAIRQASPFPPPPQGRPIALSFTYGAR